MATVGVKGLSASADTLMLCSI